MSAVKVLTFDDVTDRGIREIRRYIRQSNQTRETIRNSLRRAEMSPSAALAAEAEVRQLDRIISLGLSTLSTLPVDTSERLRVLYAALEGMEVLAGG